MTQLLECAFKEASKLTESEQDSVASLLLAELESERRWDQSFAFSQDELARLADMALRRRDEVRGGSVKTIPGDEALTRVRRAISR